MRPRAALLLALLPIAGAAALQRADDADALVVVTAHWRDRAQLQWIASRFQHLRIDARAHTAQAEASREDYLALRRAGIRVDIDQDATARMRRAEAGIRAAAQRRALARAGGARTQSLVVGSQDSIPGYACYRTVEETYATMDSLVATHPSLAKVVDIGPTWSGAYRMRALELTNAATDAALPNKPTMVAVASIHAREYTPAELLTRFGEWLANGYGNDAQATWLLDNFKFDLVLQGNPDGRKKAEAGLSWRKNTDTSNGTCSANAYGIDLNRNFNFRWNSVSGGSSADPCNSTYHGPAAASEPETRDLLRYIAGTRDSSGAYRGGALPDRRNDDTVSAAPSDYRGLFLDLHSYNQLVLWPWSFSRTGSPNAGPLRTFGRRLAYFNGYQPAQWISMYAADGTDTDAVYGLLGAPSYTIELGQAFFEDCATFESSTYPKNLAALKYAARNLWAPYVYPAGPDTTSLSASAGFVLPGTPVTITATSDDGVFNQGNGTEPVQAIASISAYLDAPPWASGATSAAMAPSDGRFDASRESASIRIDTGNLAPGRHVVYVRATDAAGQAGTPQAVYFTVARVRAETGGTPPAARTTGLPPRGIAPTASPPGAAGIEAGRGSGGGARAAGERMR
ncbi:MAG: M14 family zinc carboxypeptidase [Lysobacteraceae bacterium]